MANNKIIFGAFDYANKGLIPYKDGKLGGYAVDVCELKGTDHVISGDINHDDIGNIYTTLVFCKKESLKVVIDCLLRILDVWVKEDLNE